MKRILSSLALTAALLAAFAPAAAANDHSNADLEGVSVKIDNTIEAPAFGFDGETPFGSQGPVAINATVEFAACCDGFYVVDIDGTQVSMKWIGDAQFARVIEPGTYDRYYFTFGEPVLAGARLNGASTLPANVTVTSPTTMTVEVAPGMQVGEGFDAFIDLQLVGAAPAQLAFTGAETTVLAIIGSTAVVAGAGLVAWSRRSDED